MRDGSIADIQKCLSSFIAPVLHEFWKMEDKKKKMGTVCLAASSKIRQAGLKSISTF